MTDDSFDVSGDIFEEPVEALGEEAEFAEADLGIQPVPLQPRQPLPLWPIFVTVSGLYEWNQPYLRPTPIPRPLPLPIERDPIPIPRPQPDPSPVGLEAEADDGAEASLSPIYPWWFQREQLRLDVDGSHPQMQVSGTVYSGFATRVHWIANLSPAGRNRWTGTIWYKDGNTSSFPFTNVVVTTTRSWISSQKRATVDFTGGGASRRRIFRFKSRYFHPVEFEFDRVSNATAVTQINTCDHPNRPASMGCGPLSIETVFRRSGFDVKRSGDNVIPIGSTGTWSDAEMHDAMQTYWSRFANRPQWAMWVLFARLHDAGSNLGGIMFDDIGPNHRQGTAIFSHSFISNAPTGDPNSAAWVRRMRFWTAVHEMGHGFNLAHSWQKALGSPWIPLANEPEARSFMNYPYFVSGGQTSFFSDFEYRFSDNELTFMRHAPERFVQMGNADWFDDHGFQQAEISPEPAYQLDVSVNRDQPIFDFLEPVVLELRLTNISGEPKIVASDLLDDYEHLTVILKKNGKPARQWTPFATYCREPDKVVLNAGESRYGSLFVSAGLNGWDMAEPGIYTVQIATEIDGFDVVSAPIQLRVAPPQGYDEEYVAQDVFNEDPGRVMAFDGSMALESGNAAWQELVDRLPKSKAAVHARICLAKPLIRDFKVLDIEEDASTAELTERSAFKEISAKVEEGAEQLNKALFDNAERAAKTLGYVDFKYYTDSLASSLSGAKSKTAAKSVKDKAGRCLKRVGATYLA